MTWDQSLYSPVSSRSVLSIIWAILSFQSVSLLTGLGKVWTGAASAIAGTVIALAIPLSARGSWW